MTEARLTALQQLNFNNRFVDCLPADPITQNCRRTVKNACYSLVNPTPVSEPQLVACSAEMLAALDLSEQVGNSDDFIQVFSGNKILPGMQPHAMCYGGHQFGH